MDRDTLPLSDIVVLDLTRARSGPTAVRQLADWGADVIRIEDPGSPDGPGGGERDGPDFQNLQRNKRSITLNLKEPEGLAVFRKLVAKADVIVENYRPDVKHRLGIDYEAASAINPRIIYGSISGFGQSGPYANRPGFDQIAQGMGGLMSVTGLAGQGPVRVGIPIADLTAGIFLSQGIMLALIERQKTGLGQWVHTSLLEAEIFMLDFQAARWTIGHEVAPQAGNDHPTSIPTGVFPTADGHINIAASGNPIFARLCNAIGAPELIDDQRYKTGPLRSKHREPLNQALGDRLRTRTSAEWIEVLNEAGVPSGPIYSIDQTFADPQVKHLGITKETDHPRLGHEVVIGQPVSLSGAGGRPAVRLPAPDSGQHTDEVLASLGYDGAAMASLRRKGAI